MRRFTVIAWLILLLPFCAAAQQVVTVAGMAGISGTGDGAGSAARFNEPHALTTDRNGNIYIADRMNHKIRKVTPAGVVSTFAGSGTPGSSDGAGTAASFNEPWGIACDTAGNLYVSDTRSYKIRKIDPAGNVTTIAGTGVFGTTNGPANTSRFGFPAGIAVTRDGQTIYVADYNTHVIRRISGGLVSTVAGTVFITGSADGQGTLATFNHPYGLSMMTNGNLAIADEWNCNIRMMTPSGLVSTLAGIGSAGSSDGPALTASFNFPAGITADTVGNLFIADVLNSTIRQFNTVSSQVITYAGTAGLTGSADGNGTAARFNGPTGITYNPALRNLYVGDNTNHLVRKITQVSSTALTLTVGGTGSVCVGTPAVFNIAPAGLSNYTLIENGVVIGTSATNTITLNNLTAGTRTFTALAWDATGAMATSGTMTITVYPAFSPAVSSPGGYTLCSGQSLVLNAQPGANYVWSTGDTTASLTVTAGGGYFVSVTNSNGCRGTSATLNITALTAPAATITAANDTICPGNTTTLNASSGNSWLWSNGATVQTINVSGGTYTVTVTGANGCTGISIPQFITAYAVTAPVISPSGAVVLIQGDSVFLQSSGTGINVWSTGDTASGIWVNTTGNYSVELTDGNGCTSSSAVVSVTSVTTSGMVTATGPVSFCDGDSVIFASAFTTGNQWYYEGVPVTGATDAIFTASDSGWYYLSVLINGNWFNSDSTLVRVYPNPDVPMANDTSTCEGNPVTLAAIPEPGLTYRWYNDFTGGVLLATATSYTTPPITSPATFYVESSNGFGCSSPARLDVDVAVYPLPVSSFNYTVNPQNGGFTTTFICNSPGIAGQLWIFGDTTIAGNVSSLTQAEYIYPAEGDYPVILITYNILGCSDTLYETIKVRLQRDLFIPTTFTPNGDGKNDIFRVRGDITRMEEMRIFDQWGTLIYSTNSANPQWDGTVNGATVQNGTYLYRIRITDKMNFTKELTGPVTVIK